LGKAASGAHHAVDSMAHKAEHLAKQTGPAIDRVKSMAHQAVDNAAGAAGPAVNWIAEQGEQLNETQKKMVDDLCKYVSANPLKSVGIALATGFILSRIIR
jgi:ElaB/YqjD/DUF883 family membrane-anchored ribosome-binding protein